MPKLLVQSYVLLEYLDEGFPQPVISFYGALLLINWSISFHRFRTFHIDPDLRLTRFFYL